MAATLPIDVASLDELDAAIAEIDAIGRGGSLPVGDYTIRLTADIALGTSMKVGMALVDPRGQPIVVSGQTVMGSNDLYALNPVDGVGLTVVGRADNGPIHSIDGVGSYRGFFAAGGLVTLQSIRIENTSALGGQGGTGAGGGAGLGGGLFVANGSRVTLSGVSFSGNAATGGAGGGSSPQRSIGGGGGLGGRGGDVVGGGGGVGTSASGASGATQAGPGILLGEGPGGGASGGSFGGGGGLADGGGAGASGVDGSFGGGGGLDGSGGFGGGGSTDHDGGFGGGGGESSEGGQAGAGGFGAGAGGAAGGGGLGAGGDVFVQAGGILTIADGTLTRGSVRGGAAGDGSASDAGRALGDGIFIQGDQTVTLAPSSGQFLTISGVIADQGGSGKGGSGALLLKGQGSIVLAARNTFTGGTAIQAGTLDLAALGAAGSGPTTFAGPSTTVQIDASALDGGTYTGAIAGFASGNAIDLTNLAYEAGATATFAGGAISVTSGGDRRTLSDVGLGAGLNPGYFTLKTARDAGTGTAVTLTLNAPSAPTLAAGQDTGASATDNLTDIAEPTFSGTADPGATVTLLVDGAADGIGVAGANGAYTVAPAKALADGPHTVTAQAVDAGGDVSPASAATAFAIDTVAPAVSSPTLIAAQNAGATPIGIEAPSDGQTAVANLAIAVDALPNDGVVTLADGTTPVTAGMALTAAQLTGLKFTPTPAASGLSSSFTYSVVDQAGNAGAGTVTLAIAAMGAMPPNPVTRPMPPPAVGATPPSSMAGPTPNPAVAPGQCPVVSIPPTRVDAVAISQRVSYDRGVFTLNGSASSPAGVSSVEISAVIDDGTRQVLGAATLRSDGTFSFSDLIGPHQQSFLIATEIDAAGGKVESADPLLSLQGGLHHRGFRANQTTYTPDGMAETSTSLFRPDGSRHVDVQAVGLTLHSDFFDKFNNHGAPNDTFVFDPGHGLDVIKLFRVDDTDHDTLSFKGSDFGGSIATVLQNTSDHQGGASIVDPVSGDAVKLLGITKAQLTANQGDFAFHA